MSVSNENRIDNPFNVEVCVDIEGFNQKPDKKTDTPQIVLRIAKYYKNISLPDLAKEVTLPDAHSWTPAVYTESYNKDRVWGLWKNNEGWKEQQTFALDFDNNICFKNIIDRCNRYNILPCFAYSTFSDIDNTKFRLVFVLPEVISEIRIRNLIQLSLMTLFSEADSSCKDAARLYYGGKVVIYENYESEIDIHYIIHAVCRYFKDTDPTNASKKIKNYCESIGLNLLNGYPHIVEEYIGQESIENLATDTDSKKDSEIKSGKMTNLTQVLYYYNRSCAGLVKKRYTLSLSDTIKTPARNNKPAKFKTTNELIKREKQRNIDYEKMADKCQLFREFITGQYWAYHSELFGLATNLLCLEGGKEQFFKGLNSTNKYGEKFNDFIFYANYINSVSYAPQRCEYFCQFSNSCKHGKNIIETTKLLRGHVNIISEPLFKPIDKAREDLSIFYNNAILSIEKEIHVCKVSPGTGKTQQYLEAKNSIISVPRHELKDEIAPRMRKKGNDIIVTPKLPEISDYDRKNVEALYAIGSYSKANIYLRDLAKKGNNDILKYLDHLDDAQKSSKTVITTHERMLFFNDTSRDKLIIDEDPINTILKQGKVTMRDLINFRFLLNNYLCDLGIIDDIITIIEKMPANKAEEMGTYLHKDLKEYEKHLSCDLPKYNIKSNVFGFLNCNFYFKEVIEGEVVIHYITKRSLPDKNIIIMSATANELIYKKLFGDRVEFTDIGHVEMKGNLIQYPERSYSRYQLKHEEEHLKFLQSIIKDNPVITHKIHQDKFPNVIATYGNLSGLDKFSGQDIFLAGTPHLNPITYILFALALGYKITPSDLEMRYVPVNYNGFEFYFYTYSENPELRQIQFYLIESELQQAIGRARLVNHDCTVTVFSSFPIPGAEFRYFEKQEKIA